MDKEPTETLKILMILTSLKLRSKNYVPKRKGKEESERQEFNYIHIYCLIYKDVFIYI